MANAQHATLMKYNAALVDLLAHNLSISGRLLDNGLVTLEVHESIRTTRGESDREKASRLVSCITARVRHAVTAEIFDVLLDVLNKEPFFYDIVERIRNSCACHEAAILENMFRSMQVQLQSELEINSEVSPEILVDSLRVLPESLRYQYQEFIQSRNLGTLDRREAFRAIFHHLELHFTFLNYQLLRYLINQHGSVDLKRIMSTYSEKIRIFMERTTIQQVNNHRWSGQHDVPSHFAILEVRIREADSKYSTLMQLDHGLKRVLCRQAMLSKHCLSLVKVARKDSHIHIYFVLPSILCPYLPSEIRLVVDGKHLLNGLPDEGDNGWRAFEDDKDNDQGGVCGPSRKRGNEATNKDVSKRLKQDQGKQVKKSYQMLLRIVGLFEDTLLPGCKEKKLHQLQQRELTARNIRLQLCY